MSQNHTIASAPGLLKLGGREFVILRPTSRDLLAVSERMTAFAREQCLTPLEWVLKLHAHLPAALLSVAVREAIALGAGSGQGTDEKPTAGREPTDDLVWKQYHTLAGVRWRVWYAVSRVPEGKFTLDDAAGLVTDDNLFIAAAELDAACKFGELDPKKKTPAPPTGASSPPD
jgi:hypothetical protein